MYTFRLYLSIYKNRKKSNLYSRTLSGHGKNRLPKNSRTHEKKPTKFLPPFFRSNKLKCVELPDTHVLIYSTEMTSICDRLSH